MASWSVILSPALFRLPEYWPAMLVAPAVPGFEGILVPHDYDIFTCCKFEAGEREIDAICKAYQVEIDSFPGRHLQAQ